MESQQRHGFEVWATTIYSLEKKNWEYLGNLWGFIVIYSIVCGGKERNRYVNKPNAYLKRKSPANVLDECCVQHLHRTVAEKAILYPDVSESSSKWALHPPPQHPFIGLKITHLFLDSAACFRLKMGFKGPSKTELSINYPNFPRWKELLACFNWDLESEKSSANYPTTTE